MIHKIERFIFVFCVIASIIYSLSLPVPAFCETLRFVFLADSRGGVLDEPVNTPVLNAIISKIQALSPRPAFVVFGGDMSYRGNIEGTYTFQAWKDLFDPLVKDGIALYTVIGNHELYRHLETDPSTGFHLENQQVYQSVFTENPGNGPSGYERLVYSFTSPGGDVFFAVLDPYYLTQDNSAPILCGTIDSNQFDWFTAQAAQTKATHKILFIHTPYYYISEVNPADPDESGCTPDITFTNLWSFLDDNRFDIFACGHSHLYSRRTIDSSVLPKPQTTPPHLPWQNNVVQLINGTCGADVDSSTFEPSFRSLWNIYNDADTYYFSVVDIDGSQVTVTSYRGNTGDYQVFDKFNTIPTATILANNSSQPISIPQTTPLSITCALDTGSLSGKNADWWIVANTPWGICSLSPSGWTSGINMLFQYPLFGFSPVEIFNGHLPVGDYTFYFAVDMNPDGILDEPLYFGGVQVHVTK